MTSELISVSSYAAFSSVVYVLNIWCLFSNDETTGKWNLFWIFLDPFRVYWAFPLPHTVAHRSPAGSRWVGPAPTPPQDYPRSKPTRSDAGHDDSDLWSRLGLWFWSRDFIDLGIQPDKMGIQASKMGMQAIRMRFVVDIMMSKNLNLPPKFTIIGPNGSQARRISFRMSPLQ